MFARTTLRTLRPLRCGAVRRYTTINEPIPPPPTPKAPKSGTNAFLYVAGAAGVGGLAYYYFRGGAGPGASGDKAPEDKKLSAAANANAAAPAVPSGKKAFQGGEQGFFPLKLESVEEVSHNTKRFRFKLPEDDMVSGLVVASAILTKFKPEGAEKPVVRPYTPISDESTTGYIDLLIKKYDNGPMSTHVHSLKPGDTLLVKGPIPKYPWADNKHKQVALIAGGTGITPMYQILRSVFSDREDKTKVTLVFGNVAQEDILLQKELALLENDFPQRFRAFYTLDKPNNPNWNGSQGFINKELLKTVLPEPKSEDIKIFVCGPPGMMKSISGEKKSPRDQGELVGILKELGYKPDQVYKF